MASSTSCQQRRRTGEIEAGPRPVISLAISPDGALVAAASISGSTALIDRKAHSLARTLVAPGFGLVGRISAG